MKILKKYWYIAVIVIAVALLFWFLIHKKSKPIPVTEISPEYAEYISAVTSGVISCESTIKIVLVNAYNGDSASRDEVLKDIFSFNPDISGKARWVSNYTIEFIPDHYLESGAVYEGSFDLGKIISVPDKLKTFHFSFQVIKQDFIIEEDGLQSLTGSFQYYFLSGTLKTADESKGEDAEKVLKANLQDNSLSIKWEHSPDRKVHKFRIDSLARTNSEQKLLLSWNGSSIDVEKKGELAVNIPAKSIFKILDARLLNYPEQYLRIIFSDPLDRSQYLQGLIYLSNGTNLKFDIEDNIIKAYPASQISGESVTLNIHKGVLNLNGLKLPEEFTKNFFFKEIKPAVELVSKGVIIPNTDGLTLPFKAVNLKSVDVEIIKIFENNVLQFLQVNNMEGSNELIRVGRPVIKKRIDLNSADMVDFTQWNTFSLDLTSLVQNDPGAIYRITISFKKEYSLYNCGITDQSSEESEVSEESWDSWDVGEGSNWDYADEYYYEGSDYDDYWNNRDNPCHKAYYNNSRSVSTNILSSNLGIIAKLNSKNDVTGVVTDITTAMPLSGVTIEALDYQQQVIASAETNSDGIINLKCDHRPYFIVAKRDKERGYLILKDGTCLSLSTFDVSGEEVQKGLKGFIYGERGVWRPGDTLFLTFILEDKENTLPGNHPVIFELTNPKGMLEKRQVKTSNVNGFYTFINSTGEDAPTGNWNLKVKVGGAAFNKILKIETVKPNRLEIKLDFGKELIRAGEPLNTKLKVKWLTGAIAKNLKAITTVSFSKTATVFKQYNDYIFDDPAREFAPEEQTIFDGRLNEEGVADINTAMEAEKSAPGMLKANFLTKAFEESGEFSIDYYSITFAPYSVFVGIKLPKGDEARGMLLTDTTHTVKVVTLDADGKPVSRENLQASVYKIDWRWWWNKSEEDLASYVGSSYHNAIVSKTVSTKGGKGEFTFKIKYPDWGRYLVRIVDEDGHATGKTVYIDWPGWAGRAQQENPGSASMLIITPDKEKYTVGEKAKINIPATEGARALVSIESGSKIINMYWFEPTEIKEGRSILEIPITGEMSPNAYINVTLLQAYGTTKNDLPLRLYGYTPILVENPETMLNPEIDVPDKISSEENFTIKVKEKNKQGMTYTIAVVDEGLLSLTRFKTPDPHEAFYAREALGIKTWDIYEYLFGGYAGKIEHLFAIGGDEGLAKEEAKKTAERFKPVVKFLGPFELKKGETNTHSFKMPKYTGAVRTMLVAGTDGAYGNTEKRTVVRNSLMVLGTLPRVLGPGEEVTLPVNVFAEEEDIKNVTVQISLNSLLNPLDNVSKAITFKEPGNEIINFKLKVGDKTGIAKVKINAICGNYKADYEIELNVRNPNPPISSSVGDILQPGQNWVKDVTLPGISGTNKASLELSSFPPVDLSRRLQYLIQYPHGCVEQTTSSVFPQLYLKDITDLSQDKLKEIENNIKAGIDRLRSFQSTEGGFVYWPSYNDPDEWASNYAGHFLIEAEKKGYSLPSGVKASWVRYQQSRAQNWSPGTQYAYLVDFTQAYRLYTLALANEPELGAMNRLKERGDLSLQAKWMLAAAYALAGQTEVAGNLVNNLSVEIKPYIETGFTFGCDIRDKAMVLDVLCLLKQYGRAIPIAEELSKTLSAQIWMSTQTTAYCLVSLSKFVVSSGKYSESIECAYSIDGQGASISARQRLVQIDLNTKDKTKLNVIVTNKNQGVLYVRVNMEGIPAAGNESELNDNLNLKIVYKDLKGNIMDVSGIDQGTDFKAEVTVSNPGTMGSCKNIALTQILPSGWEIINTRLGDMASAQDKDQPDYQDIRDDRVYSYFDLKSGEVKTFVVLLNATYAGQFYLPAVSCEAMYDNRIKALKPGMWVKVVKE